MIRGIYTAAAGMMANVIRQQATTNNLANISTPGYKEDSPVAAAYPQMLILGPNGLGPFPTASSLSGIGDLGTGVMINGVETNLAQGPLKQTGNPLDFSLSGEAFFVVQSPGGDTYYTRNGAWAKDALGRLCTPDGYLVMGESGPITVPEGGITVSEDGTIAAEGETIGRLRIATFPDGTVVEKVGSCLFAPAGGAQAIPAQDFAVHQGYLEASNVDEVRSMVEMISALRSYELQLRTISIENQTLQLAVNELGKV